MTPEDVHTIVGQLKELQFARSNTVRITTSLTNRIKAILRHYLEEDDRQRKGWTSTMAAYEWNPETGRNASPYAAKSERELLEAIQKRLGPTAAFTANQLVQRIEWLRTNATAQANEYEKAMGKLAQQLPVWPWVESVRGFGAVGLAQIVAETSIGRGYHLSNYATHFRVWKRMGLAVLPDGTRQRKIANLSGEETYAVGYNPHRRSIMFVIGESLLKGNQGRYREVYLNRKAYEAERLGDVKGAKMTAHMRAQRYMEKALLRDLWNEWCSVTPS